MGHVIGIDLGTTNSVVAFLEGGKPQVMQNAEGHKTTPSIVLYNEGQGPLVGELAKRQRLMAPKRTIYSVKRFVGCRWNESEDRRENIEYPLVQSRDGLVAVDLPGGPLLPEQIQAEILKKMKQTAEDFLGQSVTHAVITCPAYFNDSQRSATKKAAELAGLEALRIINEPTAAALAYGLAKNRNQRIAVFDFGGGTFDISILDIDDDVFEVKATCGDTFLGGDCIDRMLTNWIVEQIKQTTGVAVDSEAQAMSRIAEAAEKIKCELSSIESTSITLPFIVADATGPKHFNATISRPEFEAMIAPVLERLRQPCMQALQDAGVSIDRLDAVILVGGSTRIPAVRRMVAEIFGREPDHSVSPDEAVALGASIQAGIMNGDIDEILLLDVTPLSLGIELAGGLFSPLIPRNSSIPTTARKKFTTVRDNQRSVKVHVLQGERKQSDLNRTLARFRLENIPPAPRELPEIEVSFTIDANGILNVAAMELTSGLIQQIMVESYQPSLDSSNAEAIAREASDHANDDRDFTRKVAIRRAMEEIRLEIDQRRRRVDLPVLSEAEEKRITEAFFRLDLALTSTDWNKIDHAHRELRGVFQEVALLAAKGAGEDVMLGDDLEFDLLSDTKSPQLPAEMQMATQPTEAAPEAPAEDDLQIVNEA